MQTRLEKTLGWLRISGVGMILAAAATFLIQNWKGVSDIQRYLSLLAFTAAVPIVSYICGIRMRESRSARLLMATVLALVPFHSGILAGFVLSQFGSGLVERASVPIWSAPNPSAALLVVAGAFCVLAPLVIAGFRVLDRNRTQNLSLAFGLINALLLVPTRDQAFIIVITMLMTIVAFLASLKDNIGTLEARGASALLWLPALVLVARQFFYYEASYLFVGVISAMIAIVWFGIGRKLENNRFIENASVLPALIAVASFLAHDPSRKAYAEHLLFAIFAGVVLLIMAALSKYSRAFFMHTATGVVTVFTMMGLFSHAGPWPAMQALIVGLALVSYGLLRSRSDYTWPGAILGIGGFAMQIEYAIRVFNWNGWFVLACLGIVILVGAAWLERRAARVRTKAATSSDTLDNNV